MIFDVGLLFKIGAMGVLLMIIDKLLKGSGKEEYATLANIAGITIILLTIVGLVANLFDTVKTMFTL